ncbi:MAG TPA: hypothetical protein VF378_02205 [Geothrix sp.]
MLNTPAIHLACNGDRAEFWESLRHHAGTGTPVVLAGLDQLDPAEANRLVHFFLHEPAMASPIQPLAALLTAMLQKRELSLWDLHPVEPGAAPARAAFLRALPQVQPACLACACFPVCQGYGAWAGSCEAWLAMLTGLAAAARALSRQRPRHSPHVSARNSELSHPRVES